LEASDNQTICSGSTQADITLSGQTGSIQWQSSTDNNAFNNISGATTSTLTAAQMGSLAATAYTVRSCYKWGLYFNSTLLP
jgi:hypothetical protein